MKYCFFLDGCTSNSREEKKSELKLLLGPYGKNISLQKFHLIQAWIFCDSVVQVPAVASVLGTGRREMFSSHSITSILTKRKVAKVFHHKVFETKLCQFLKFNFYVTFHINHSFKKKKNNYLMLAPESLQFTTELFLWDIWMSVPLVV